MISSCMYQSLSSMFRNSALCVQKVKPHQDGFYSKINDGSYFKNSDLFSQQEHDLQIQPYYDDFETANPLGSRKGVYLAILRNLPPKLNCSNIHLVAFFHSVDLKKYRSK